MPAITGPGGGLPGSINKRKSPDRFIRGRVDVLRGTTQRITENVASKLLAIASRAYVIGQEHDVTRLGKEVVIPSARDRIRPHARVPAMNKHQQGVLFGFIKRGWQSHVAVNSSAQFVREPKFTQRLPVNSRRCINVE